MATFRELFGEKFSPDMPLSEAEKLFEGKRLADLSTGEYVSKAKYDEDTRRLAELTEAEGRHLSIYCRTTRLSNDDTLRETFLMAPSTYIVEVSPQPKYNKVMFRLRST